MAPLNICDFHKNVFVLISGVDNGVAKFPLEFSDLLVFFEPGFGIVGRHDRDSATAVASAALFDGILRQRAAFSSKEEFTLGCLVERLGDMLEVLVAQTIPV